MRPIKLTLQGFGSYGSQAHVIDFTEPTQNIFLITGDTGAGKSTIFDAIVFALYGESSSDSKSKKGSELQSQFSSLDVTPFVELVFSEREGGEDRVYTIKRIPAHDRLKERGKGITKGDAEACLTLPNGDIIDRPISRIDDEIVRIVKLDKGQFKKVAMLAQGEFMAMLGSSSKEKKQIFRGLFNTEIYSAIAQALLARKNALQQGMDKEFAVFRGAALQVGAPSGYDADGTLSALVEAIASADMLDIVEAKQLIESLTRLNDAVFEDLTALQAQREEISKAYEAALASLQEGRALSQAFMQLERANAELEQCERDAADVASQSALIEQIDAAYDISSAHAMYAQARDEYKRNLDKLERSRAALPGLQQASASADEAAEQLQCAHVQAADHVKAIGDAVTGVTSALSSIAHTEKELRQCQKEFTAAKARYAKARDEFEAANAAFLDSQAGYVAKELKPGKPCPVCGSVEHPAPHTTAVSSGTITAEDLKELKDRYDKANSDQGRASAEAGRALQDFESAKRDLQSAVREMRAKFEEECADLLAPVDALLANQDVASSLSDEPMLDGGALDAAKRAAGIIVGDAQSAAQHAATAVQEARRSAGEAQASLAAATRSMQEAEDLLPRLEAQGKKLKARLDALIGEKGETGKNWEDIVKAYSKADIKAMQAKIDAFNSVRSKAQGVKDSAEETIGDNTPPDMTALEQAAQEAKESVDGAYAKTTELSAAYEANVRAAKSLGASFEKWAQISEKFDIANELYRRLSGNKTGGRMDLETFVQRYYFRQILQDANCRLREMTNNEYEFRMVDEQTAATGSNKGLDVRVYSSTNDAERDIKTLSGGESFMAALAFALGMSDQIVAKRSSVNVDIMFIDEGFGSLDDNARKLAVDTLRSMTGDGRMIGIISHVSELKQAIDNQLIVTKDDAGSHAEWHLD